MWPLLWMLTTPAMFLGGFALVFASVTVEFVLNAALADVWRASFLAWAECALQHYNGQDSSWHALCGSHPARRMSPELRSFFNVMFMGQSSCIAVIYSRAIWQYVLRRYTLAIGYRPLADAVPVGPAALGGGGGGSGAMV